MRASGMARVGGLKLLGWCPRDSPKLETVCDVAHCGSHWRSCI